MARTVLRAALLVWLLAAGLAFAQEGAVDYDAWTDRAAVAETITDRAQASTPALEELRREIADWRDRFQALRDLDADRIATLQAQIDSLGPESETGDESAEIAQRRAELTNQLQELREPALRAQEAHTRADGIIGEIDAIIRDRQTDALLEHGASPLNPAHWAPALADLRGSLNTLWRGVDRRLATEALRLETRDRLPLVVVLVVAGVLLIARGHAWSRWAVASLRGDRGRGSGVQDFLVSLGQICLPLLGVMALIRAALESDLLGARLSLLIEPLPWLAAVLLGTWWLADRVFSDDDAVAVSTLPPEQRPHARLYAYVLAVLLVANALLMQLIELDGFGSATTAVLSFPLLVVSGLTLFQLGRLALRAAKTALPAADDEASTDLPDTPVRARVGTLLARGAMIVGIAGPVVAAFGYTNLGLAAVYPAIVTLALFGLVLVLQSFFEALYTLAMGPQAEERETLFPVLTGFLLTLAAMPLLALIWGARVADLTELWTHFREGFAVGENRIQPTDFLMVIVVFALGYTLTRLVQGALRSSVLPRTRMEQGAQTAIVSGLGYVGMALAALAAISAGGLDLSSLAIVAGALSVGIGFGLRTVVENFVSGILLLIERPISEGDWIEVGGQHGFVKDISVRSTRIETFDRFDLIVPNADLISGVVRNYTRGNSLGRVIVPVGVAYGSDTRAVEAILLGIARRHEQVLMNPAPYVYFKGFGDSSLDFEIRAILRDVSTILAVTTEMNHQIVARFAEEGIEIPFPQRDMWLRNPEAMRGGGQDSPAKPDAANVVPREIDATDDADASSGQGEADGR